MIFRKPPPVRLVLPRRAIEAVFDECDRYDADETGGRLLGTYEQAGGSLAITVNGIIEPGPKAKRTPTYFLQDGDYQERVFRDVESDKPEIEHLGNWHTHHVNGLRHLSPGDIATYRRIVEHANHNTDFFLALLVIEKKPNKKGLERYIFKNYLLRRGDDAVYEIPASALKLTDDHLVWPSKTVRQVLAVEQPPSSDLVAREHRATDQLFISEFFPKVKTFKSPELGIYWRGRIGLVDGSEVEVVLLEAESEPTPEYTVTVRNPPPLLEASSQALSQRSFGTGRAALVAAERALNGELFGERRKGN